MAGQPEQDPLKAQLEGFTVNDIRALRLKRAKGLPPFKRKAGEFFKEQFESKIKRETVEEVHRRKARHEQMWLEFCRRPEAVRRMVYEHVFPSIADLIEPALEVVRRGPLRINQVCATMRAPRDHELTHRSCKEWMLQLPDGLGKYDQPVQWYAQWAPHFHEGCLAGYCMNALAPLLAGAIDAGGTVGAEVKSILFDSAAGRHPIGRMGQHIPLALLSCADPECWEFVEKMLLAAQREEGLRQSILESVQLCHPEAFRRMLRLIVEHGLARFSSVVRAADVWLGFGYDSQGTGSHQAMLERLLAMLEDPEVREKTLAEGSGEDFYLALFAIAFEDLPAALVHVDRILPSDPTVDRRAAALYLRLRSGFPLTVGQLLGLLEDEDVRIGWLAMRSRLVGEVRPGEEQRRWIEGFRAYTRRLPAKPVRQQPLVWPWLAPVIESAEAYRMMIGALEDKEKLALADEVPALSCNTRRLWLHAIRSIQSLPPQVRPACIKLVGDASMDVRELAISALDRAGIEAAQAPALEEGLRRKCDRTRKGIIALLLKQKDREALASADRLLASNHELQRLAGLELLRLMVEAGHSIDECRRRAAQDEAPASGRKAVTADEARAHVEAIVSRPHPEWALENGFGLFEPAQLTPPVAPRGLTVYRDFTTARACLKDLERLFEEHKDAPVDLDAARQPAAADEPPPPAEVEPTEEALFEAMEAMEALIEAEEAPKGNGKLFELEHRFPAPEERLDAAADLRRLPLGQVWTGWFDRRPAALRDPDGLELLRAKLLQDCSSIGYGILEDSPVLKFLEPVDKAVAPGLKPYKPSWMPVFTLLLWHHKLYGTGEAVDYLLDLMEQMMAAVPPSLRWTISLHSYIHSWRDQWLFKSLDKLIDRSMRMRSDLWTRERMVRLWKLRRWQWRPIDEARPGTGWLKRLPVRIEPPNVEYEDCTPEKFYDQSVGWCVTFELTLAAVEAKAANEADVLENLTRDPHLFYKLTQPDVPLIAEHPWLGPVIDRLRERLLEIEYERGDTATEATELVTQIRHLEGRRHFVRLLRALERHEIKRGGLFREEGRSGIFSKLLRVCVPAGEDTAELLAGDLKAAGINNKRLIEIAVFSPQWAGLIGTIMGQPALEDGVWWLWAHMSRSPWGMPRRWMDRVTESTAIRPEDLREGAVDVEWFGRVRAALDSQLLDRLVQAARFASDSLGHTRAKLFAEALLGRLAADDTIRRIEDKRHPDSVRALGLIPLPAGEAGRAEVLRRYKVMQEFLRTSRQFGSQRRASERRATESGMENLARTAGYPDPLRLEWSMELEAVADLAAGPVRVIEGDVEVRLEVDALGHAELLARRGDKELKGVPPAVRKKPAVKELDQRKVELRRQHGRMRLSLEQAMCRGDAFTAGELRALLRHPVLRPMLTNLVFIGEPGLGMLDEEGRLIGVGGTALAATAATPLRLAHPVDLFASGEWPQWQRDCFLRERIQPFKQIFREFYPLTEAERRDGDASRRYAGQQVQPRQAMALLGQRGWVTEEGIVRRSFHREGISAWLQFLGARWTPAEVEGLTLEAVHFTPRFNEYDHLKLEDLPPRVFSEVMRDLDLVVSVAHRGGVDPEASQSTIEMRAALLGETVMVLGLENIRLDQRHAMIEGRRARYSVHLGSGVTHVVPGGALVIVPVHAQHRGRLFLPFADDDPRTAEILSKILWLAADDKIKDPFLLDQIAALTE